MGNNIPGPKEIAIPEFENKNDYITKIECGKRNSAIITKFGEIWITGNYKTDKVVKDTIIKNKEAA